VPSPGKAAKQAELEANLAAFRAAEKERCKQQVQRAGEVLAHVQQLAQLPQGQRVPLAKAVAAYKEQDDCDLSAAWKAYGRSGWWEAFTTKESYNRYIGHSGSAAWMQKNLIQYYTDLLCISKEQGRWKCCSLRLDACNFAMLSRAFSSWEAYKLQSHPAYTGRDIRAEWHGWTELSRYLESMAE
jgi:hypothetical protein